MNRILMAAAIVGVLFLGFALRADAQNLKQQVVGTWNMTKGMEKLGDKTTTPWAAGRLVLDAEGRLAFFLVGKDRAKGDPNPRTPVGPFIAYYGTYTVDEAAKTVTYHIEHSAFPNFEKSTRTQKISFSGDTMITTGTPVKTAEGEVTPINEWKRAK